MVLEPANTKTMTLGTSQQVTMFGSGAASVSPLLLSGTPYPLPSPSPSASPVPMFLIQPSGVSASTAWSNKAGGTSIGVNEASTFLGNFLDLEANGTSEFSVSSTGLVTDASLTASDAVFTNSSKQLVSNAITGSGNVVMSAAPTISGAAVLNGTNTLGSTTQTGIPLTLDHAITSGNGAALTIARTTDSADQSFIAFNGSASNNQAYIGTAVNSLNLTISSRGSIVTTDGNILDDGSGNATFGGFVGIGVGDSTSNQLFAEFNDASTPAGGTGIRSLYQYTGSSANGNNGTGLDALFYRSVPASTNVTDTGALFDIQAERQINVTTSGKTYTNSNLVAGIYIPGLELSGSGAVALSSLTGMYVAADSSSSGTNKYGIFLGAQTGASNNYGIYDAGVVASSSSSTGQWVDSGGLGVGGSLNIAGTLTVSGNSGTAISQSGASANNILQGNTAIGYNVSPGIPLLVATNSGTTTPGFSGATFSGTPDAAVVDEYEAAMAIYTNDGTKNQRAKLFSNASSGVWGFQTDFSSTDFPFEIISGTTKTFEVDASGNATITGHSRSLGRSHSMGSLTRIREITSAIILA